MAKGLICARCSAVFDRRGVGTFCSVTCARVGRGLRPRAAELLERATQYAAAWPTDVRFSRGIVYALLTLSLVTEAQAEAALPTGRAGR